MNRSSLRFVISVLFAACGWPVCARAQEFRALWADTFHGAMRTGAEVTALVNAARAGNCNAVVVEVRKRGDAYYRNGLEPVATDVAAGFDPLADLVVKAHNTSGGKARIEVHAWMVTYNIWGSQNTAPPQASHPYNLHPDWLSEKYRAATTDPVVRWDGAAYPFDQGHPAVQQHTFDVSMDILRRYDVDGLHFDYIRYSDDSGGNNQPWGYNPVTVARFKKLKNRVTTPLPTDTVWLQWRRDQVTALLRKVYLNAWAEKPNVRISAALITYGTNSPGLGANDWANNSEAYRRVLQDWRGWMEEGILDLACPMTYKTTNASITSWVEFIRQRQYRRSAAVGLGWYLNSVAENIGQIKLTRAGPAAGPKAAGSLGYSYAVTNEESVSTANFLKALTDPATAEIYDPGGDPVFAAPVAPPPMPWKTDTARGHLMGFVKDAATAAVLDGATVSLTGPAPLTATRAVLTDGTGFFGSVDLPVGTYTATVSVPGYGTWQRGVAITGAQVRQESVALGPPVLNLLSWSLEPATRRLTQTWTSEAGQTFRVEYSDDLQTWFPAATAIPSGGLTTTYRTPAISPDITRRWWRVRRE
ncbi:MAG: family 10 glycosylhydrolase [Verrucomicrobiota bacterium]